MTDTEIIKSLECCGNTNGSNCSKCPMYLQNKDNDFCHEDLMKNILDLIKRQGAEIERLQNMLAAECQHSIEFRNNTIKEFAERLKKTALDCDVSFGYGNGCYVKAVTTIEIDNLVKEMTDK